MTGSPAATGGGGGGGGGTPAAGGGYNIPISVSRAETTSLNPNFINEANINFGSGDIGGNWYEQENTPYQPATAVSSASQRDAAASVGDVGAPGKNPLQNPYVIAGIAAAAIGAIALTIYLTRK